MGIAIDKGYIRDVNVPISEYFPEILESSNQNLVQDLIIQQEIHICFQ